jgi:thiosulfate/3-mercaptopyruvate sulfurtransferase
MALKTGTWAFPLFLFLFGVLPLSGQDDDPLRWPLPVPKEPVFPRVLIHAGELAALLKEGSAVPLDVRTGGAYEQGHLPGAVPLWSPEEEGAGEPARIRSLLAARGITGEEPLVLYGGPDPEAVARLFWLLRRAGCGEVRILNEDSGDSGLTAWRAAGGDLETHASRRPAVEFRAPRNEKVEVDAGWLAESFGHAGVEVLDVRDPRGWERWETPPTFAAGHVPYSLPFDPRSLLPVATARTDAPWPDPAALRKRLSTLGPRPGDPVSLESTFILYGEDARDPRLGLGYLLLTLAGLDVRVFPGGWREWTAGESRPVIRVISAAELAGWLKREDPGLKSDRPPRGLILIDLREARDFAIGHLSGARVLPFLRFPEKLEETIEQDWPSADRAATPLVFYCYGIDCVRSRKAGAQAVRLGFRNVLWFRGGIQEWRDAGYPLLDSPLPTGARKPASNGGGAARP